MKPAICATVVLCGIVIVGCGRKDEAPPTVAPASVSKPDSTDVQASQTTQQKTLKKYTAADYDSDRATVREWLSKRPQAASVKTVQSGNDSDLEVTLQPDVSDKASRRLAHEIRVYLTHHLPGERALAVSQVSLLGGKGSAHPDSEQSQSDGSSSLPVSAIVTTSFNAGTSNDAEHPDTSWHVFVNGDQVE